MRTHGFTLLELIVVMVIMGITTIISVPYYNRNVERMRGKTAEFNLMTIFNRQKRFILDNGAYYVCPAAPCAIAELNAALEMEIIDPYFTYSIEANGSGYTASALRNAGGQCAGQTITITDSASDVQKECSSW